MDCHVATLLAETVLHRLPRPSASQRQKRVIANATPSLRLLPSLCERSEAIHLANRTVPNHGLPRPTASQRRISVDCHVATLLAETDQALTLHVGGQPCRSGFSPTSQPKGRPTQLRNYPAHICF